jgi:hypothetical protein
LLEMGEEALQSWKMPSITWRMPGTI